jgi:ATP:ADP antiporter, AAA family
MKKLFAKIVDVKPDEIRALLLAFVFNFVVLGGYYVIRPIRDEIGADRGVENLPWMYTGTLIGMLIANTLYATIVARMSRRRFIPIGYRFAILNLLDASGARTCNPCAHFFHLGQRLQSFRNDNVLVVHG